MFNYLLIIFYLNICLCPLTIRTRENNDSELKMVILVHRHGDRTPISCYPTDPYKNSSNWLDGWGQLTQHGKSRMYNLGKYIRKRYVHFLGDSPRETHIRSSAADRCLESVALVLAGIYPPEGRWQWNNDLGKRWQPFPIQTEPRPVDGMLNTGSICPAADEEVKRIHNSKAFIDYTNGKKHILKFVADNTGLNVTDLNSAEEVFDTLLIEKENNKKLPRWVDEATYESLQQISDITFYFDYSTKLIQRLRTGLLLEDISKHLREVLIPQKNSSASETSETFHKLRIYSTHDTQIAVLLNAFNVFNMKSPPFGSSLIFELYEKQNDHIIKIYYLNVTESEEPHLLSLPDCVDQFNQCRLDDFIHSIEPLIPINWNHQCHNDKDSISSETVIMSYVIGSILTFGFMAVLIFLFTFSRRKGSKKIVYQMLPIG